MQCKFRKFTATSDAKVNALETYLGVFPKEFWQQMHCCNQFHMIITPKVVNT